MRRRTSLRLSLVAALVAVAALAGEAASSVSAAAAERTEHELACPEGSAPLARVKAGTRGNEPELYPKNQANAYGVLEDKPTLPSGSVTVPTVFHMIGADAFTAAEMARWRA